MAIFDQRLRRELIVIMDKYILAKQIADLIANPLCEDSTIYFDDLETEMYPRSLYFYAEDNRWVFSNFRCCNFIDGYDDYVHPMNLHHYISQLKKSKDILHLKKVRNIIWDPQVN